MERRVLLAVFLSFLVLYVYQGLIGPPSKTPSQESAEPPGFANETTAHRPVPNLTPQSLPRQRDSITAIQPVAPEPVISESEPRDIVVESDTFRAVFVNQGPNW